MQLPRLILFASLLLALAAAADSQTQCSADADCGAGLRCSGCIQQRTCTPIRPIDPQIKAKDLPFNRYSWLTTHNSFALKGENSETVAPTNQEDSVTAQLNNGVRGLMLDMYDFENNIWLCHSFGGNCYNVTAFQPAINVLKEIQAFLAANPSEVVTIFIEDYVTSPNGLTKVFNASGLLPYWFPVSQMPKNGSDWPLLSDMVKKNHRLLVFTSKSKKEASEGIAYEWTYVVENQYGDEGLVAGSCPNRAESSPMNTKSKSLVLMNHFPTDPFNLTDICLDNSDSILAMLKTCHDLSANRWPNFIAVDYYKRGNGGGAQEAIDNANGHLVCGCDSIAYCKANSTFGTCEIPPAPAPSSTPKSASTPTAKLPSSSNLNQNSSEASSDGRFFYRNWVIRALPLTALLLL